MLKELYQRLKTDREEQVEQAVKAAVLTIPKIFPREGQRWVDLPQNHQSTGARGVSTLSSKLGLTLFPPTLPFMKLEVSPVDRQRLQDGEIQQGTPEELAAAAKEIDSSLLVIEKQAASIFNKNGWRPAVAEAIRLAVVTGDSLIYDRPEGRPAVFDLHNYVVERDPDGTLLTVILRQQISKKSAIEQLGETVVENLEKNNNAGADNEVDVTNSSGSSVQQYSLYTGARRTPGGKFEYFQEFMGVPVDLPKELDEDELPLIPLRFGVQYGSAYGRGYVEDYFGHLLTLERIMRSLSEGSEAIAKMVWLIREGSTIKPKTLATAPNLAIRQGNPDDVGVVRADKGADMAFVLNFRNAIEADLQSAFLLNSSFQRNGERVTAEEIRLMSQELEDALGGVYASLADTIQAPIVYYLFRKMKREGQIQLPAEVQPVIATGLEAISRNHIASRIAQALGTVTSLIGPERVDEIIRRESIARDVFTAYNLNAGDYVLSDEEIAQREEAAQQQAILDTMGPEALRQAGNQATQQ